MTIARMFAVAAMALVIANLAIVTGRAMLSVRRNLRSPMNA